MRSPRTARKSSPCLPQLEKARVKQRRPNAAKQNKAKQKNQKKLQKTIPHYPNSPGPGNRHSTFCLYESDYSRYLI